jgi:SAM-dependent methyltransferase
MTVSAFDPLAPTYDRDFTASPVAAHLRDRVHLRLERLLPPGTHALELGCGTGEDALRLARRGVRLLATDTSAGMLAVASDKLRDQPLARVARLDLRDLPADFAGGFDGAYANFGVLNCLEDWRLLAVWLAQRVRLGGYAAFCVMSPFCLWEIAWHGLHREWAVALRRLRGAARFDVGGAALDIRYPTIRRLTDDFAPHFRRIHVEPLGVLLPPTDAYGAVERRPGWLRRLLWLERCFGRWRPLALFGDHYWIEFERI